MFAVHYSSIVDLSYSSKYNKFGRTYLFDLDFHHLKKGNKNWETMYVVDAYHAGNVSARSDLCISLTCNFNIISVYSLLGKHTMSSDHFILVNAFLTESLV